MVDLSNQVKQAFSFLDFQVGICKDKEEMQKKMPYHVFIMVLKTPKCNEAFKSIRMGF